MIVYIDSSLLARAYLADEDGHEDAAALLEDRDIAVVTGSWTRIEVSGALVRAGRGGRRDPRRLRALLAMLDGDLGPGGVVATLLARQEDVEERALDLVRDHGIRAMDAWHLAVAAMAMPPLGEPGEALGFATRDAGQGQVAELLGFVTI